MGVASSSEAEPSNPGFTPVITLKKPGTVNATRTPSQSPAPAPAAGAKSEKAPADPAGTSPAQQTTAIRGQREVHAPGTSEDHNEPILPTAPPLTPQTAGAGVAGDAARVDDANKGVVYGASYPPEMIEAMMQEYNSKQSGGWFGGGGGTRSGGVKGGEAVGGGGEDLEHVGGEDAAAGRVGKGDVFVGQGLSDGRAEAAAAAAAAASAASTASAAAGGLGRGGLSPGEEARSSKDYRMIARYEQVLSQQLVDLNQLQQLCWSGCPNQLRPQTWRLLLRYAPGNADRRQEKMARLRSEYADAVINYFDKYDPDCASAHDKVTYNQIFVDLPRTNPAMPLFQDPNVQQALHRILYVWAIRHPGTGYVQGINDIVTPFFFVFLMEVSGLGEDEVASGRVMMSLPTEHLQQVEADSYHCLTMMLDKAQDNYVHDSKGIQEKVFRLKRIIGRLDEKLVAHLEANDVEFLQFAFRWFNCLLMRELSMACTLRLWDTYVADKAFASFHVYVCAAVLLHFSKELQAMDFQGMIFFLQKMPTDSWQPEQMELILAQAYSWCQQFSNSHV